MFGSSGHEISRWLVFVLLHDIWSVIFSSLAQPLRSTPKDQLKYPLISTTSFFFLKYVDLMLLLQKMNQTCGGPLFFFMISYDFFFHNVKQRDTKIEGRS